MPEAAYGPEVPAEERLNRVITSPYWWVASEKPISSAAFAFPVFSVDMASLAAPEVTLAKLRTGCGIVQFIAGPARELGFDACVELDERFPDNHAHANVYCALPKSERKRRAQELVALTTVVHEPAFS